MYKYKWGVRVNPPTKYLQPFEKFEAVFERGRAQGAGAGFAGMGSEIAAFITEHLFDDLDAPVERVTGADAPMPYAKNLEQAKTPSKQQIIQAIKAVAYA